MNTVPGMLAFVVILSFAGCAGAGPTPEERQAREQVKEEAIEDILSTPLGAEEYAGSEPARCLSSYEYRSVEVLDDQHVVFRGNGDKLWINQLRRKCVGLRRDEILRFEMRDNRVCDLDSFESVNRGLGYGTTSGICTLGTFKPVTPEQLEAIELAVKESKRRD